MSSFSAAGSGDCELVSCNYSFNQSIDDKGRPSSKVQGGIIKVTIVSTDSAALTSWMLDPYKRDKGKITFMRDDQESTLKEISFDEAYCVEYSEHFDARGADTNTSMTLSLTTSANKINANGAQLDNKWV